MHDQVAGLQILLKQWRNKEPWGVGRIAGLENPVRAQQAMLVGDLNPPFHLMKYQILCDHGRRSCDDWAVVISIVQQ